MEVDHERLGHVVLNWQNISRFGIRGAGRTFAACHKLAVKLAGIDTRSIKYYYAFFYPCWSKENVRNTAYELRKHIDYFGMTMTQNVHGLIVVSHKKYVYFDVPRWNMRHYIVDEIVDTFGEFGDYATREMIVDLRRVRMKSRTMEV